MFIARVEALQKNLEQHEMDVLAVLPGPSFIYLTGISFHLSERPIMALFPRNGTPLLVLPRFERSKAETAQIEFKSFDYDENPSNQIKALLSAASELGAGRLKIGVEPLSMRYEELNLLERAMPEATILPADALLTALRGIKDDFEIESMRRAAQIAEQALEATLPLIKVGMTEIELASELVIQLLRAGSEPDLPFYPIVASGPNAALSHAVPGERKLAAGDVLVIDWGARMNGYVSDITRTFAISEVDPELERLHEIVKRANSAGIAAIQPGAKCSDIDRAARNIIESAGYGEHFTHRTGHGIGLAIHENPYIRGDNDEKLSPGMSFTVEPGIYLQGKLGVRIEDNIVVSDDGVQILTSMPRDIQTIS
ncbi:MAG: aminopeptidase P family protein [Chloroflexi bacterium]|nr:aminopeptidase P family protein [Chloroflexota bacterium]